MNREEFANKIAEIVKAVRKCGVKDVSVFTSSFEDGDCMLSIDIADWTKMKDDEEA